MEDNIEAVIQPGNNHDDISDSLLKRSAVLPPHSSFDKSGGGHIWQRFSRWIDQTPPLSFNKPDGEDRRRRLSRRTVLGLLRPPWMFDKPDDEGRRRRLPRPRPWRNIDHTIDGHVVEDLNENDFAPTFNAGTKELPMLVKGTVIAAQHDTGAEGNIMAKNLTKQLGLSIEPIEAGKGVFKLANGKIVRSVGRVFTNYAFALDTGVSMKCSFYVWEKVAGSGMIMGRAFLKATKTLSSFRHRLRKCTKSFGIPMLREISSTTDDYTTRLLCTIDNTRVYVNSDTGSEIDAMSASYAQQAGHYIDSSQRKYIQLGDGTVIKTIGQVSNVRVSLGNHIVYKTFDVLPSLDSGVILGEVTLDELEAYTEYEDCFADLDMGPRNYEMNIIVDLGKIGSLIRPRKAGKSKRWPWGNSTIETDRNISSVIGNASAVLSLAEQIEDNDQREMCRHDAAEKSIAALAICNPAAAVQARTAEDEKRRRYQEERLALLQGSVNTIATQGS